MNNIQVITRLENGKIRVYKILHAHMLNDEDPLTTIEINGYEDIDP